MRASASFKNAECLVQAKVLTSIWTAFELFCLPHSSLSSRVNGSRAYLDCRHQRQRNGARPSSGAAISACRTALECSNTLAKLKLAAPGTGALRLPYAIWGEYPIASASGFLFKFLLS